MRTKNTAMRETSAENWTLAQQDKPSPSQPATPVAPPVATLCQRAFAAYVQASYYHTDTDTDTNQQVCRAAFATYAAYCLRCVRARTQATTQTAESEVAA